MINVETEIRGTLPKIDPQAIVNVKKVLKQEFKRTGEGRMQSRGTVKYEVMDRVSLPNDVMQCSRDVLWGLNRSHVVVCQAVKN